MSKSNADKLVYQTKITGLETILLNSGLLPTLSKTRITSRPPNIPNTSSDKFHFTTVNGDSGSCHAILVYVKTNDNGQKTVYYYDPAGKQIKTPHKFKIDGTIVPTAQINKDMCPDKGINPEGYCALWSIVVVILWDSSPDATFEERLSILQSFNSKIVGGAKVPGLRKWFIATIYHLLMKNRDYTPIVTAAFINAVRDHIKLVLDYDDSSSVKKHVDEIVNLMRKFEEKKQISLKRGREDEKETIELDKSVDAYIDSIMRVSGAAAADAKAAAEADAKAAADADGGAAAAAADAKAAADSVHFNGGGLRRARSLRRKNKMYRSKKLRKKRRTATQCSKRNYRK
jgi:hypothetical protein